MTWPIFISDVAESCMATVDMHAQPEKVRIFESHLKIIEHVLKYVTHCMLSTVLKYVLRIFELPGPGDW